MSYLIGQPILNFIAQATGNKTIQLTDFRGHYVVLYFYPKDNTPGCTQEAQDFKNHIRQFSELNTVILGVSRDSLICHEKFKTKQSFTFDLISDHDEHLCQLFDVIKMKMMYGKQIRGIERSSFLINPEGILIKEWRKVKVANHIDDILKQLQQDQK